MARYTEKQLNELLLKESIMRDALNKAGDAASKGLIDRLNVQYAKLQKKVDEYPKKAAEQDKEKFDLLIISYRAMEKAEVEEAVREQLRQNEKGLTKAKEDKLLADPLKFGKELEDTIGKDVQAKAKRKQEGNELIEDYVTADGTLTAVPDRVLEKYMKGNELIFPRNLRIHAINALFEKHSTLKTKVVGFGRFPNTLTRIDAHVFEGCQNLTMIKLPAGLKSIGSFAFKDCASLRDVWLPKYLTTIYPAAFMNTNITRVNLPEDIDEIGDFAFKNCYALNDIYIPDKLNKIGVGAFAGANIKEFRVGKDNEIYSTIDGNLYDKQGETLIAYAGGKDDMTITVSKGTKHIGAYAFAGLCSQKDPATGCFVRPARELINLPDTVETIDTAAFKEANVEVIDLSQTKVETLPESFAEGSQVREVKGLEDIKIIEAKALKDTTEYAAPLIINAEKIGDEAFAGTGATVLEIKKPAILGSNLIAGSSIETLLVEALPLSMMGDAFFGATKLREAALVREMFFDKNGKMLAGAALKSRIHKYFPDSNQLEVLSFLMGEENCCMIAYQIENKSGDLVTYFRRESCVKSKAEENGQTVLKSENEVSEAVVASTEDGTAVVLGHEVSVTTKETGEGSTKRKQRFKQETVSARVLGERDVPTDISGANVEITTPSGEKCVISAQVGVSRENGKVSLTSYSAQQVVANLEAQEQPQLEEAPYRPTAEEIAAEEARVESEIDVKKTLAGETAEFVQTLKYHRDTKD